MIDTFLQFEPGVLLSFVFAGLLLNITPGADFLLVTTSAVKDGPRIGRAAAVGINLGILVHVLLAAAGFSALLITYPAAYTAVLYLGAFYLLFMAYRIWHDDTAHAGSDSVSEVSHSQLVAFKRGLLTNVLNPKTAVFIFAFIPQFTNPAYGPLWHQMLILGLIFLINGLIFVLLLATAAAFLSPLLKQHLRMLNKLTAVLFSLLALRLLFA